MPIDKEGGRKLHQIELLALGAGTLCLGISALLAFAVGRRKGRSIFRPWPLAWSALAVAIGMLYGARAVPAAQMGFVATAIIGYGAFSYWFLTGLGSALQYRPARLWWLAPPAYTLLALVAAAKMGGEGSLYFAPSLILTCTAFMGLVMFYRARRRFHDAGDMAVITALGLLLLSGVRYVVVTLVLAYNGEEPTADFWIYNGAFDLIIALTLAIGTMLMVTDRMRAKLQERNTELASAKDALEIVANVDPLTGVSNRYSFHRCIQELGDLESYNGCLLMIDINNLKVINDTRGHSAGDHAICAVAERLGALIRSDDRIFRWGGDEFVVLLFNASPESAIERISRFGTLKVANGSGASDVEVSISWGVSPFGAGKNIEDVLKTADVQLYSSRRALG
ncbi:MAG: diguanylate cyclase [Candidatus Baltobacteraceae bacterium]